VPVSYMLHYNEHMCVVNACSLSELGRAIKGLAVMSAELEAMFTSLLNNQVRSVRSV
jgi:hypothetical protein